MRKRLKKSGNAAKKRGGSTPARRLYAAILGVGAVVIILCGYYILNWYVDKARVNRQSAIYQKMYAPAETETGAAQTPSPTLAPSKTAWATASAQPEETPAHLPSAYPTPDAETIIYALATEPPVQESFSQLLLYNPDTIGYLTIGKTLSLPVVWRENDNEYYLTHAFSREEAKEGALFLDGANRLSEGDQVLIVYGHNMKNGTMFAALKKYADAAFLAENAVVNFDTIYENGLYVPFAMFSASMDETQAHYFDVRQFVFDETTFELFVLKLQARSSNDIPIDVKYGDQLLLLVTCSSDDENGRYIVALRKLRDGETPEEITALVLQAD